VDKMIYTNEEKNLIESLITNGGQYQDVLEKAVSRAVGVKYAHAFNSVASSHLVAILALSSPKLKGRALQAGDEVILSSINPPSVVSAILQTGATPVFIDISLISYSPTPLMYSQAITENTKAMVVTHIMGNPDNLTSLQEIAEQNNLWMIEICDEAFGEYDHEMLGTFGNISCVKAGNLGMVLTNSSMLHTILLSMKNCGEDFTSHVGLNLSPTEIEAGISYLQFLQSDTVSKTKSKNWEYLYELVFPLKDTFLLPSFSKLAVPQWTGFLLTLKVDVGFTLDELEKYLIKKECLIDRRKCRSITKCSAFILRGLVSDQTPKADFAHSNGFYISLLETEDEYIKIIDSIKKFMESKNGG